MDIKQSDDGKKGVFYIVVDGKTEAQINYTYLDEITVSIDHTEVGDKLRGQGVGYKLVDTAVEFFRSNNIKAKPLCSYAASVFKKKHDNYKDVLC